MTPQLAQMLLTPLGRSTPLEAEAERQLTGEHGTLTTQLGRLLDAVGDELRELLGVRPDLPPRRAHPWTLLTEHESQLWPMLALSRLPTVPPLGTARIARHLATAHLAMEVGRCRAWAHEPEPREVTEGLLSALVGEQPPTWADLLSAVITVQAHHLMLHSWGVLSAYVGLNTGLRLETARTMRRRVQEQPELCASPPELAAELLWASLGLLHGGLPRPEAAGLRQLAHAMRSLPERTVLATLPEPVALAAQLQDLLPRLPTGARRELAERLSGRQPTDAHQTTTGLLIVCEAGCTALWLRRAGEVQLIVGSAVGGQPYPQVSAWRWRIPKPAGALGA